MTYIELKEYLKKIGDQKFATFSKTLSNSDYLVLGVKNPVLRSIIKEHKNDAELNPNDFEIGKYLEIDFIYFGLSLVRLTNTKAQLQFLKDEIRLAKSWAITDCVSTYLKKVSFEDFFEFYKATYKSKYTYERRMAYILALKQYRDERVLKILPMITLSEEYMVMMAEAWFLSVLALSFEDEVFSYLKNLNDLTLKRKTISKISDSYRFDISSKDRFKSLR